MMECNVSELVKRGHVMASELKEPYGAVDVRCVAQLISDLATKLQQLAVDHAALKAKGREFLGEASSVYAKLNKLIDPETGDFIDGQTLYEFQRVLDAETPSTDAFIEQLRNEARAEGVGMFASFCREKAEVRAYNFFSDAALNAEEFAAQLRNAAPVEPQAAAEKRIADGVNVLKACAPLMLAATELQDPKSGALAGRVKQPGADGWIEWNGGEWNDGECPTGINVDTSVQVCMRNGGETVDDKAGAFRWSHTGDSGDIIAYRVCKGEE